MISFVVLSSYPHAVLMYCLAMDCKGVKEGIEINTSPLKDIELVES
jgi:hypothetical protein